MAENLKAGHKGTLAHHFPGGGFGSFDCPKHQDNYFHVGSQQWVLQVH